MGTEPDNHTLREFGSGAMTRHDTEVLQREGKTDLTQTSNFRYDCDDVGRRATSQLSPNAEWT